MFTSANCVLYLINLSDNNLGSIRNEFSFTYISMDLTIVDN